MPNQNLQRPLMVQIKHSKKTKLNKTQYETRQDDVV